MARPKTPRARLYANCTPEQKQQIERKLISCGFTYTRQGKIEPCLSDFVAALSDKPLEWFKNNFQKPLDKLE